jgi:pyrroline-5-carboxylate reductase
MKITFVGGGNMAQAIIGGLTRSGFAAADIAVVEPVPQQRERLAAEFGVAARAAPAAAGPLAGLVVMAVKPQQMRAAAEALAPLLGADTLVLSIAAGIRLTDLARWLGGHRLLARCMPNTPALIGAGMTAAYALPAVSAAQRAAADQVLAAMGKSVWLDSEALLDPVTAVSGSGPAYVFYFIEALEAAARELGLAPEHARQLALETFLGAAKLAAGSADEPAALRARVTSKGGTTEAALAALEASGVKAAIIRAVRAANARSVELGAQLGKD